MTNGIHALQFVDPTPMVTPADRNDQKPGEAIEHQIGAVVADAVVAIAAGVVDWAEAGGMSPTTKALNGERLGAVALLRLDHLEMSDFDRIAFTAGRRELARRHQGILPEAVIADLIGHVVTIAERVTNDELMFRKQHAH